MYAAILKDGRSSDYKAYLKLSLFSWIESLPLWYFIVGNNVCVCTEHLLAPFLSSSCHNPENDAYNIFRLFI
jgi:hypothetical protein